MAREASREDPVEKARRLQEDAMLEVSKAKKGSMEYIVAMEKLQTGRLMEHTLRSGKARDLGRHAEELLRRAGGVTDIRDATDLAKNAERVLEKLEFDRDMELEIGHRKWKRERARMLKSLKQEKGKGKNKRRRGY